MSTLTRCSEAYWCVTRLAPDLASDFRLAEMSWSSLPQWERPVLARGTGWALRACAETVHTETPGWCCQPGQYEWFLCRKTQTLGRVICVLHFGYSRSKSRYFFRKRIQGRNHGRMEKCQQNESRLAWSCLSSHKGAFYLLFIMTMLSFAGVRLFLYSCLKRPRCWRIRS